MQKYLYISFVVILTLFSPAYAQVQTDAELKGASSYIQAMEAFANQEYEKSRDLLLIAYEKLGQEAGINYALADVYLVLDDLPSAALYGKRAVTGDPANKWYRFKLAQIYRNAGENQATLSELETLLEYYPNDFDALFMLADTYKDYGEFIRSNQVLDHALKITGPERTIYFLKFQNFQAMGVRDSAIVQLEALRKLDPDDLLTLNLLSEFYSNSGDEASAKEVLNEALLRNSRDPQSLINLAGIYIDEQKWDSAGTLLGNFISDKIILPEQRYRVAQYLYVRQQEEPQNIQLRIETGRILDLYTESAKQYGPAFTLAGQFYAQANEPAKALLKLEQANTLLPEDDIAWRQRLQLLLGENQIEEAIEVGKEADENVPDDAFIQFFIGTAYILNDENKLAVDWLTKASRAPARRPFKSVIYGALGDAHSNLDEHEEADRVYELALRFDPENHNAMNNYAYNLSLRSENLERAKELALNAIELDAENAAYLDTVGWVYFKLGDYDRARRFIKASIDIGEASAEVYEHMGDVYEKLGNLDEAKKWWKQALDMDSTREYLNEKLQ